MKLSRRAAGIGESATLSVSRKAKELAAQGVSIVDLSAGEPVAVVPGVAFGDDDHVRLSFATSRDQLREGLARISEALAQGD